MSKHTKAPWTVAKGGLAIQLSDGSQIRQLRTVGGAAKHNAQLIAAAPMLLETLKAMLRMSCVKLDETDQKTGNTFYDMIIAAIISAGGSID